MHYRRERECGQHIREVSDKSHNGSEPRHKAGNQRHSADLHRAEDHILGRLDKPLSVLDIVALDGLVDGLHPERESADHRDDHEQIDRDREPRAVGKGLQDVALHAVGWE